MTRFLAPELAAVDRFLPGLREPLDDLPAHEQDDRSDELYRVFKSVRGPALAIPAEFGGVGCAGADLVRVQRAVGFLSPSLAVATAMHHFSIMTMVALVGASEGPAGLLVEGIAKESLLVASGFAEGRPGRGILDPTMGAVRDRAGGGFRLTGSKRPCSLTWSMDLLTASARLDGDGEPPRLGVFLVPAAAEGLRRRPFWGTGVLRGAQSDEIVLDGVLVPEALAFFPVIEDAVDPVQMTGLVTFELLITASYLGIASALLASLLEGDRGGAEERARLVGATETCMTALEGLADGAAAGPVDETLLARALFVRYGTETVLEQVTVRAAALLGGMAFVGSHEVAYRLAAARALAFHPPSVGAAGPAIGSYLAGAALRLE